MSSLVDPQGGAEATNPTQQAEKDNPKQPSYASVTAAAAAAAASQQGAPRPTTGQRLSRLCFSKVKSLSRISPKAPSGGGAASAAIARLFPGLTWSGPSTCPDQIDEGLYLGGLQSVSDREVLQGLGIASILTVARGLGPRFPGAFKYTMVEVDDAAYVDIAQHFPRCFEAIDEGRVRGGVVVHCLAGVSRSATVVVAYLMKTKLWTLKKALTHVRRCRPIVCPNSGFMRQLEHYDVMLTPARRKGRRK